jgi:hypothetical protein
MIAIQKTVHEQIKEKLKTFNRISLFLQYFFLLLATTSVACSLAVATYSEELGKDKRKHVAYTAALSSALIGAFSLERKASDSRKAWRLLKVALMRRDLGPPTLSEEDLIKFYAEAENTLGHITFDPAQQESNILKDENEQLSQKIRDLEKQLKGLQDSLKNNPANPVQTADVVTPVDSENPPNPANPVVPTADVVTPVDPQSPPSPNP